MNLRRSLGAALAVVAYCAGAAGQNVVVSGHVVDAQTGESVAFASCADVRTGRGTTTNGYGFFSLQAAPGTLLSVSCMGYERASVAVGGGDTSLVVRLAPAERALSEVTVRAALPQVEQTQMSKNTVPVAMVRAMPSFTGEPDVMKAITFLPGVSAGRDGMSEVFVRGGDRGQNLILLDGMKIYNSSHMFGLVSLFNSDIVRNVDVYKGVFPAEYGGRLASVINVLSRDGNTEARNWRVSVGMLSSTVSSEGPIGDGRLTYSVAARAAYDDLFNIAARRRFYSLDLDDLDTYQSLTSNFVSNSFYDVNGRLRWRVSPSASLALSVLVGSDFNRWGDAIGNLRGPRDREVGRIAVRNDALSLTFAKSFGPVFWRTAVSLTNHRTSARRDVETRTPGVEGVARSGQRQRGDLRDFSVGSRVEAGAGPGTVKAGVELSRYVFSPSSTSFFEEDARGARRDSSMGGAADLRATEATLFVSDELRLGGRLSVDVGLRATLYGQGGDRWSRLEPRLSSRFLFGPRLSVKAGYARANQFNHSIVGLVGGMQSEAWVAATRCLPPQQSDQVALGLFFADDGRSVNFSVEGYYKWMRSLFHSRSLKVLDNGAADLDRSITTGGDGRAYGVELMASKDFARGVSVNAAYAWAVSERRFAALNGGRWFPALFDRRHQLTLVGLWDVTPLWRTGLTFNLASGSPFTMPSAYVRADFAQPVRFYSYTDINNRRAPAYHRLDVNVARSHTGERRGVRMQWALNVFNVYARKNPSHISYSGGSSAEMLSDYTILPSLSYSIWF